MSHRFLRLLIHEVPLSFDQLIIANLRLSYDFDISPLSRNTGSRRSFSILIFNIFRLVRLNVASDALQLLYLLALKL